MVVACGTSQFKLGLFHLVNHAFFKALLFLGAGAVIHIFSGQQDIRKMGGLRLIFPLGMASMALASCALAGLPFFAGFYSKEAILTSLMFQGTVVGFITWFVGLAAALCTSAYSAGLIYYIYLGRPRGTLNQYVNLHKPD
jgi:NADH:ubiquinone oxidoreductase subunit 5 (subunit L)/multisubunit Na+/H+ antiporter MnhA subunit